MSRKKEEYDRDYDRGKVKKVKCKDGKLSMAQMAAQSREAFDGAYGRKEKGVWKAKSGQKKDWRDRKPENQFKGKAHKKKKIY